MARLRCVLFGRDCPPPERVGPARPHEPIIHEARNLRTAIRANAEMTERLAAREQRVAAESIRAVTARPSWEDLFERRRPGGGDHG